MLDHQTTARNRGRIKTASYAQVGQPIYSQSAGRWNNFRKHLEPVLPVLAPWVREVRLLRSDLMDRAQPGQRSGAGGRKGRPQPCRRLAHAKCGRAGQTTRELWMKVAALHRAIGQPQAPCRAPSRAGASPLDFTMLLMRASLLQSSVDPLPGRPGVTHWRKSPAATFRRSSLRSSPRASDITKPGSMRGRSG